MKMRWVASLLLLGVGMAGARADGFGLSLSNAAVTNQKGPGNTRPTIAEPGDFFFVTNAKLASYRSFMKDPNGTPVVPSITDGDLDKYSVNITGTVADVSAGNVHYTGTFTIVYSNSSPAMTTQIEHGTIDLHAAFDSNGNAVVTGLFTAAAGVESSDPSFTNTDFSPFNPGRFYGVYTQTDDPTSGVLTGNLQGGAIGFAISLKSNSVLTNNDENGDGRAEIGETFDLTAGLADYFDGAGAPPLTDNDLSRYTIVIHGTVSAVNGTTVTYSGPGNTFQILYNNTPATPHLSATIETGSFSLTSVFASDTLGAAKLTGQFIAKAGPPTDGSGNPVQAPFDQTDFAVFNPGTFSGTYTPIGTGHTGNVNGSLIGGTLGFSASIGNGVVANIDTNGDGRAEVGEQFQVAAPLSSYAEIAGPPLLDKDLSRYTVSLSGTVVAVAGNVVTYGNDPAHGYTSTFRITYNNAQAVPPISQDIETGTFTMTATFDNAGQTGATGTARVSGTLVANPGSETSTPPFSQTDFSPFNPAVFTGRYGPSPTAPNNAHQGSLRGSLVAGTQEQVLNSRNLGFAIEGSPSATVLADGTRRVAVVSGSTLYVIDPDTGDDAVNWYGGKVLPDGGKVFGRPVIYSGTVYLGTDKGTLYAYDVASGALVGSGQPDGSAGQILTTPAVVPAALAGTSGDQIVVAATNSVESDLIKVNANALGSPLAFGPISSSRSVSSPSVSDDGYVYVGSDTSFMALRYTTFVPSLVVPVATPTSPLAVTHTGRVYVGVGDGSTLDRVNGSTGSVEASFSLGSPLQLGAFYEKSTDLIEAGLLDGRVLAFNADGSFAGYTLPGIFNNLNTAVVPGQPGSRSMPVVANDILYRGTENRQILSGSPLDAGNLMEIDTSSPVRSALATTGNTPGTDWVAGVSADGTLHLVAVR